MSFHNVTSGRDVPNDINVIIEIPAQSDPVKYEVDKESGALFVDRFMATAMSHTASRGSLYFGVSRSRKSPITWEQQVPKRTGLFARA